MRVCVVSNLFPPVTVGGAEAVCFQTASGLRDAGHDVHVITGHPHVKKSAVGAADYVIEGIKVRRIFPGRPLIPLWKRYKQLYNTGVERAVGSLLKEIRPDIVHLHNLSGLTLSPIRAVAKAGIPAVITMHDYWSLCPNNMLFTRACEPCRHFAGRTFCAGCFHKYDYWGTLPFRQAIIRREIERGIDRIVTPSRFMAARLSEGGYSPAMLRTIYHGMDIASFRKRIRPLSENGDAMFANCTDAKAVREKVESSDFLVQFAGHLTLHKGGEYLIRALSALKNEHKTFTLAVTGMAHPRELSRLKRMISSCGIAENVVFVGKIGQELLPSLYARADAVVVPSIWYENASVVIAEAMMAGTPVIASDLGGNPEFVKDGHNGFTFRPKDHVALSHKLAQLIADPALAKSMGRNAAIMADDLFAMSRHIREIESCYDNAIIARRGA